MIEEALNLFEADINISKLSKAIGMNISTMWFKIAGRRKWDVETWLMVLYILGMAEIEHDVIRINFHINKSRLDKFNLAKDKHRELLKNDSSSREARYEAVPS